MSGFVQYQHERHYIAYIRQPELWLKCDDAIVTPISGELESMWPSLIFLQRYRRHKKRRLEHPVEVMHRDLLRCLPQCLHALVAPGQPTVAAAGGGWRPGRFAVRLCRRRRSEHRRRKRRRQGQSRSGLAKDAHNNAFGRGGDRYKVVQDVHRSVTAGNGLMHAVTKSVLRGKLLYLGKKILATRVAFEKIRGQMKTILS